jgi:hypothetical protein
VVKQIHFSFFIIVLIISIGCRSEKLKDTNLIKQYTIPVVQLRDSTLIEVLDNVVFMNDSCDVSQHHFRTTFYANFYEKDGSLQFYFDSEYGNYFAFTYLHAYRYCLFHRSNIFIIEGDSITLIKLFRPSNAVHTYKLTKKSSKMPSTYVKNMRWSKVVYSGLLNDGNLTVTNTETCK